MASREAIATLFDGAVPRKRRLNLQGGEVCVFFAIPPPEKKHTHLDEYRVMVSPLVDGLARNLHSFRNLTVAMALSQKVSRVFWLKAQLSGLV